MVSIKVRIMAGEEIANAFSDCIKLANKLDSHVDFSFNGVECIATPDGSIEKGVAEYEKAIRDKNRTFRFAVS